MIDLNNTRLFTPSTDPESQVTSYILTNKVAPVQQGFYFVNNSLTDDGRYLWFYCAFPPSKHVLGVVDFQTSQVRYFPETEFGGGSPFVDTVTGDVVWGMNRSLWQRGPGKDDQAICLNTMPDEIILGRSVDRLATHLTRTADGKGFFIDMKCGLQFIFGVLPIDGGDFDFWYRLDRCYNHAQASPTDPNIALFAQEIHGDPITGLSIPITNRVWIIRKGEKPRPVFNEPFVASHEWWDKDGKHAWCVSYNDAFKVDTETGKVETIPFPHHCWHCHSSHDGSLMVGDTHDGFDRGVASSVHFMNRQTGKLVKIINNPAKQDYIGRNYHIDPHPRFCCDDKYIVFTTTIRGEVDVAIVPVESLLEQTA